MTAQRDINKDITSDSQVNSYFPYRWSPASLTLNIYFYIYLYLYITRITINNNTRGWSGGSMVLGKLSVPGRPTSLDKSRARAYCTCSRCGWGLSGHFYSLTLIYPISFLSPSLWETTRYRLKYCL